MLFIRSRMFIITVLIQVAGPFFFSFGDWANVIQYLSGFGMAYGLWDFNRKMNHLHQKHDKLHEQIKRSSYD